MMYAKVAKWFAFDSDTTFKLTHFVFEVGCNAWKV